MEEPQPTRQFDLVEEVKEPSVNRPDVKEDLAIQLVGDVYGLKVETIEELASFEDKNFRLSVAPQTSNSFIPEVDRNGYVLKILNHKENADHPEAEHQMMRILQKQGFNVPSPVPNLQGNEISTERIIQKSKASSASISGGDEGSYQIHVIRLLHYIPGVIYSNTPYTSHSLYEIGKYIGKLQLSLKGFSHPALTNYDSSYSLINIPRISSLTYVIKDEATKQLIHEIIDAFLKEVVPYIDILPRGSIHGDVNENNIVMTLDQSKGQQSENQHSYIINGIIDFGDAEYSCYMFDVAKCIAHMMKDNKHEANLLVGGYILAGYFSELEMTKQEFDLLRICVAGRIAQVLTLVEHSLTQDPKNDYIRDIVKECSTVLHQLWNTTKSQLYEMWYGVIDSYQT